MAHSITVPRLGWSMEEGVFCEWLKLPGEFVRTGEMIFMLEGEKAAQEIESLDSGFLAIPPDAPKPGTTVKVGEIVGYLIAEGEAAPSSVRSEGPQAETKTANATSSQVSLAQSSVLASEPALPLRTRVAGPASRRLARQMGVDIRAVDTPDPTGRVLTEDVRRAATTVVRHAPSHTGNGQPIASPRARKRARELGIDWTSLTGTGRGGRIREQDVLNASPRTIGASSIESLPPVAGRHQPASKLRKVIAARMMAGVHEAAPVTLTTKVDAQHLVTHRELLKRQASAPVPSYNDMLLQLVAMTLREQPQLNACWYREGVYLFEEIHLALAVDTNEGLLAPVIRHVDRLSLAEIAIQSRQLVELTRAGQLKHEQLSGGTFTVTNLGAFGIDAFTPILNLPQAAILGIGRVQTEPVVRDNRLDVGQTLALSLTFDHRAIDGAPAARWLKCLCEKIESGNGWNNHNPTR